MPGTFAKMRELQARATAAAKDSVSARMSKQVAKVLNRTLGYYIDGGIDTEKFELDVFSGRVVLRGLQVNQDAFTALGLPMHLVASYVGEIELDIPFANLKTEPILVTVRQVYISLSPDADCDKRTMEQLQLEAHEANGTTSSPSATSSRRRRTMRPTS